jgi:glycosyltransferase involved in cell wall biosynthesis
VRLVVPAPWDAVSGGSAYDRELAGALRAAGAVVEVEVVDGAWPVPSPADRRALARVLRPAAGAGGADERADVVVDGLVAAAAPDEVAGAVAAGVRVHVLVHLPLALEGGLADAEAARRGAGEGEALRAATSVLATSRWAAADLRERHGLGAVGVAVPGTHPAPVAPGSRGGGVPQLLHLAAVGPRKHQRGVVAALARLRDLPWTALLAGPAADPAYALQVDDDVAAAGLAERVRRTGPLRGADLEAAWDATDLLLLPSTAETWGMAVTEALARGVPAVVGAGTGAQEALGTGRGTGPGAAGLAGAVVAPGDVDALATALRHLLDDGPAGGGAPARRTALRRRAELRVAGGWDATAAAVLDHLAASRSRPAHQEASRGAR